MQTNLCHSLLARFAHSHEELSPVTSFFIQNIDGLLSAAFFKFDDVSVTLRHSGFECSVHGQPMHIDGTPIYCEHVWNVLARFVMDYDIWPRTLLSTRDPMPDLTERLWPIVQTTFATHFGTGDSIIYMHVMHTTTASGDKCRDCCSICLCEFEDLPCYACKCENLFHKDCFKRYWTPPYSRCPLCRADVAIPN